MPSDIAILGAGYVGTTTAAVLAERGHRVVLVDPDEAKIDALRDGRVPLHEPGLDALVGDLVADGRLTAVAQPDAVDAAEHVYICVGTPPADDGSTDLSQVRSAATDAGRIAAAQDGVVTVVVKSTVPPGTTRDEVRPRVAEHTGGAVGEAFGLAANPEFLREGSALADARAPDRIVVGVDDAPSRKAMDGLVDDVDAPVHWLDIVGAETVKYLANAFLATKISFANEAANLCRRLGVDLLDVMDAVTADDRVAPAFFVPGAGFGGSCFPKDVRSLAAVARRAGVEPRILDAVLAVNEAQPGEVVDIVDEALDGLAGRRVALLGLAFKAGTDDVRNTRALPILAGLRSRGAEVVCHDPRAGEAFRRVAPDAAIVDDLDEALADVDAAIVQAAWPAYLDRDPGAWPDVVVDGRRAFGADRLRAFEEAGVTVHAVGRGDPG